MPRDPVVVLHVYLGESISGSIHEILPRPGVSPQRVEPAENEDLNFFLTTKGEEDQEKIKAAIFYSISSTQKGLKGVDLGHYLIKNAVKALQHEFPKLSIFSTLSPIPGFKEWFMQRLASDVKYYVAQVPGSKPLDDDDPISGERLFLPSEMRTLMEAFMTEGYSDENYSLMLFMQKLQVFLTTNKWFQSEDAKLAMEEPLMRLCVRYLYHEKHRGFALNPVANFHLRNGASMWRVNWLADTTSKGLSDSFGIMVNYRYFPEKTGRNNQKYAEEKCIDVSENVAKWI